MADRQGLATTRTTEIVPVDLNCLLYQLETTIAALSERLGDAAQQTRFSCAADERRRAILACCWDDTGRRFSDVHWPSGAATEAVTAAVVFPLFVGIASREQAALTAALIEKVLLAPGGLRTSTAKTGEQWDSPNGWAPLHWIAVEGLLRYGYDGLARSLAERWVGTVERCYSQSGHIFEKYDVERASGGIGGEYPVQIGFGWTNGVTAALIDRFEL